jgi:hypothetical protein
VIAVLASKTNLLDAAADGLHVLKIRRLFPALHLSEFEPCLATHLIRELADVF